MRFADEVVPRKRDRRHPGARSQAGAKELALATQIIDSLASDWDPKRYHDTYTEELRDLIERKAKGEEVTVEADDEEPTAKVIDLMAALQASLESGRRRPARRRQARRQALEGDADREEGDEEVRGPTALGMTGALGSGRRRGGHDYGCRRGSATIAV